MKSAVTTPARAAGEPVPLLEGGEGPQRVPLAVLGGGGGHQDTVRLGAQHPLRICLRALESKTYR